MPTSTMSVVERIRTLKSIFADFGIPVLDNSLLDQTITAEFGRGKRSELNQILLDLRKDTDAGILAAHIGAALQKQVKDPQVAAIAKVMRERLPSLLQIIDVREQTSKRIELLEQLLGHFEHKLTAQQEQGEATEHSQRLLRMLTSAREQLRLNIQLQTVGSVIEKAGIVIDNPVLRSGGKILQSVVPMLISLEQPEVPFEQKVNYCVQALKVIGKELHSTKLTMAANIIDNIHWLAKITLPEVPDQPTIDQALQNLGLSLGMITISNLRTKALAAGLTEKEVTQILYAHKTTTLLERPEQELLAATQENQQYAAICGFVAKMGQDINCKELEMLGTAAVCLIALRQTYYEVKTNNLNVVNFSESLGVIVANLGILTKNQLAAKVGGAIIEGVRAYAGIMAIPGGQAVAVPLAVGTVLTKLFLSSKQKTDGSELPSAELLVLKILEQTIRLQQEMRRQFTQVYAVLQKQHQELLVTLDKSFADLQQYAQQCNANTRQAIYKLDHKLDTLQLHVSQEFADLYLEYIRDPVEEIQFYERYGQADINKLQRNKLKLSMWLLHKAKHQKVNGRDLVRHVENTSEFSAYVALVLNKLDEYDSALGLVNRYVNLEFMQQLPEELPHIPSWLLAAETYIYLLNQHGDSLQNKDQELQIIQDIHTAGVQIEQFVSDLAANTALWHNIVNKLQQHYAALEYNMLQIQPAVEPPKPIDIMYAESAPESAQLEKFDPVNLDISQVWQQYFAQHIPAEFNLAIAQGLGNLQVNFTIDPAVNNFAHVHMAYSNNFLPDNSRDVLYKIEVFFKSRQHAEPYLLVTGWFAYDLGTAHKRFAEYYSLKFMYRLKHTKYNWISLNGMHNQLEGHGQTDTHKLIDYNRLATVYKTWWPQVQPVNDPIVLVRVRQNAAFNTKCTAMLDQGQCLIVQEHNIAFLQLQLQSQLHQQELAKRINVALVLQEARVITQTLGKIDAYNAVLGVFKQILNMPVTHTALLPKFQQYINTLRDPSALTLDLTAQLRALLAPSEQTLNLDAYKQGVFYQKVQHTLTRLQLLTHSFNAVGLRFNN